MNVTITLNNGVVFQADKLHTVLKEMHTDSYTNGTETMPKVPPIGSGVNSYISWVSNRMYSNGRVDLSINDPAKFLVMCVQHGYLKSIAFESVVTDENDFDAWNIPHIDDELAQQAP